MDREYRNTTILILAIYFDILSEKNLNPCLEKSISFLFKFMVTHLKKEYILPNLTETPIKGRIDEPLGKIFILSKKSQTLCSYFSNCYHLE